MEIPIQLESVESVRSTVVPAHLGDHVLVRQKYFYTLPLRLLKLIVNAAGKDCFDVELLKMELTLSKHVGDHGYNVGTLKGVVFSYHLLGDRKPVVISEEHARRFGLSHKTADETAQVLSERLDALGNPVRGYVGWLLTNPEFLKEHDALFRNNRDAIRCHGIPKPVVAKPVLADRDENEPFVFEFQDFCHRWRLQTFAGPYLPLPIEPQVPDLLSKPEGLAACMGMTTFSLPDIFPVSGRGELQSAVDDAVHGGAKPGHLAGWYAIIDSANSAKNPIIRYVRLFQFQHFVRVLYSRHAAALYRKKTRVLAALADFFSVSEDTIKSDWKFLDDKVGKDWHLRSDPLG